MGTRVDAAGYFHFVIPVESLIRFGIKCLLTVTLFIKYGSGIGIKAYLEILVKIQYSP